MCDKKFEQLVNVESETLIHGINANFNDLEPNTKSNEDLAEGISSGFLKTKHLKDSIDRFDDNLIEDILQCLSFSDKISLETVSKQWQRTIYNKQAELHLNRNEIMLEDKHNLDMLLKPVIITDFASGSAAGSGFMAIKKDSLESILKKSKFIKTIVFDCYCDGNDLELIAKFCPHLERLELCIFGLDEQTLHQFGLKYGHKLKFLKIIYPHFSLKFIKKFLNCCENLLEFSGENNLNLIEEDVKHLPKLETLKSLPIRAENLSKINVIVNKYIKTLRRIELYFYLTSNKILIALSLISRLKYLRELRMDFSLSNEGHHEKTIDDSIEKIGKGCAQLEDLNISVHYKSLVSKRFFCAFKNFQSLKRLNLFLYHLDTKLEGSVECFKNSNLKYLRISYKQLSDEFFDDIHLYLPNLKAIDINTIAELTDKTVYSLSKLKNLRQIIFLQTVSAYIHITDDSICHLLDSCDFIQVLTFNARPNITNKTIEKLIETALRHPRQTVQFYCGFSEAGNEAGFFNVDINDYNDILPQNLNIIFENFND